MSSQVKKASSGLFYRHEALDGNGICCRNMLDVTVGMSGLRFMERIINLIFSGERTNVSIFVPFHYLESGLQNSSDPVPSGRDCFGGNSTL